MPPATAAQGSHQLAVVDPLSPQSDLGRVEVAPGQYFIPAPVPPDKRLLVCDLVPTDKPGHYKAVGRVTDIRVRLTEHLPARLGVGISMKTIRRLIVAGFVKGGKASPGAWLVNIASLYDFLELVEADPGFWTPARIRLFKEANDL